MEAKNVRNAACNTSNNNEYEKKAVEHSGYILGIRECARALVSELCTRYGYATILCVDSSGKSYRVSSAGRSVTDEGLYCNRGCVVRVVVRGSVIEHSFSSLSEAEIPTVLEKIERLAQVCPDGEYVPHESANRLDASSHYLLDPEQVGEEWILGELCEARERAMSADVRIFDCTVRCTYSKYTKLFISPERDMIQSLMWTCATIITMTKDGDRIKDSYQGFSNLGGAEIIQRLKEEGVDTSVRHALELRGSLPMPAGEYECICSPDVTGLIVHEAFGHGVEMDMFVRDRALAREYMGRQVASPLVSMHDSACAVDETASCFFDDEGNVSTDTLIIDRGILVAGMADEIAAAHLGTLPTGNGKRECFSHKAYTRMTNTYFEQGEDSLDDMIASIDYGFYLDEARSGMEDPKNWGIQCVAGIAREIRDGKFTGRIFSPAVITGYVPELLCSISMMSRETELRGTGMCGKGHKEWVKVSDGGPAIKARVRLS